jgi:SAM-dependent methyltransferase
MQTFDKPTTTGILASEWIMRFSHLVKPKGTVLDVAAGHGRHAEFFLRLGCSVVSVDIDVSSLAFLSSSVNHSIIEADLDACVWPFPNSIFDAIIVTNYLNRNIYFDIVNSLSNSGVLLMETFGEGNQEFGRPRNPDFLLASGELIQVFEPLLQIVSYEHGLETEPRKCVRQRICARKGALLADLNAPRPE